jgi:hypothetical protein
VTQEDPSAASAHSIAFELSEHAEQAIVKRKLRAEWIAQVLAHPDWTEPDAEDPELRHALARIPAYGDRVLRVIYNETVSPWRIVTAFFDRRQRSRR